MDKLLSSDMSDVDEEGEEEEGPNLGVRLILDYFI